MGTFNNGSACASCESGCSFCNSEFTCFTCMDGYYISGTTCFLCDSACATCEGYGENQCLTCKSGYYKAGITSCQSCSFACDICTGPTLDLCTTCKQNYARKKGVCAYSPPETPVKSFELSAGEIVGIALGAFACFVIILVSSICICYKLNQRNRQQQRGTGGTISWKRNTTPGPAQQMPESVFGIQPLSNQPPQMHHIGFLNHHEGLSNTKYQPKMQSNPNYSLPPGFAPAN